MDYHSLMDRLAALVSSGHLGRVEIAKMFPGKGDVAFQVAVRDLDTSSVDMHDLYRNGVLELRR